MRQSGATTWSWGLGVGLGVAGAALLVLAGVVAGLPLIGVGSELAGGALRDGVRLADAAPAWKLLGMTVVWSSSIALIATLLALPVGWRFARSPAVLAFCLLPIAFPNYAAYWTYGLLRAPNTLIGRGIERAASDGAEWLPVFVGRVLAFGGLSLWVWPIAAVIIAISARSIGQDVREAAVLDGARGMRGMWLRIRLVRRGVLGALAVVFLIMLGSAVPLHLANAPTVSVQVWLKMLQTPGDWRIWLLTWPMVGAAAAGAWAIGAAARAAAHGGAVHANSAPAVEGGVAAYWLRVLLFFSVCLPLLLFGKAMSGPEELLRFWPVSGAEVASSLGIAAWVGVAGAAAALLVKVCLCRGGAAAKAGLWAVRGLLFWTLLPGVLTGAAWSILANGPLGGWLGEGAWQLIGAHATRFAGVGALVGCVLAGIEPRTQRDTALLDGVRGIGGVVRVELPRYGGGVLAAGLVTGLMSVHEIESTIFVQPAGRPSLASQLLGYLHYQRDSAMGAAGVWICVCAVLLWLVLGRALRGLWAREGGRAV